MSVKRHAKAPSAGSTTRQGSRIAREAAAARASSPNADGSGAPSAGRAGLLAVALLAVALLLGATQVFGSSTRQHSGYLTFQTNPASLAVDQANGDVYVLDTGDATISRYDSAGSPLPFSALNGSNVINGSDAGSDNDITPQGGLSFDASSQVAVDSSGTATDGNIYVANSNNNVISVFDETGAYAGQLDGTGTNSGAPAETWAESFAYPCGVATDSAGRLYVATAFNGQIDRYVPAGATPADADLDSQITDLPFGTCGLAVDSAGNPYVTASAFGSPGTLTKYAATDFPSSAPSGTDFDFGATAVAVDPTSGDVFADNGPQVTQYDSSGSLLATFGQGTLADSHGVAIDRSGTGSDGALYVSDSGAVLTFGPLLIVPDSTTGAAADLTDQSATLNGQVDPDGEPVTDCTFEWGTDTSYGNTATCNEDPGSGSGNADVTAQVTGLEPNTEYHFRLTASNANGQGPAGADQAFTTEALAPTITPRVPLASTDSATLRAQINPHNSATTYYFEWGSDESYGNTLPIGGEASVSPTGNDPVSVSQQIIGQLQPETTYSFRVVATNAVDTVEGPNQTFETPGPLGAFELPDNRAWEMVSPPDKNGADIVSYTSRTRAAGDGNAVSLTSLAGFADTHGRGFAAEYIARRTATPDTNGWSTHGITPKQEPISTFLIGNGPGDPRYMGEFSEDLNSGVGRFLPLPGTPDNVDGIQNLFVRDDLLTPGAGDFQLLTDSVFPIPNQAPGPFPGFTPPSYRPYFIDASADFSHVTFQSDLNLIPGASGNLQKLYEWEEGTVRLVGVLPAEEGGGIAPAAVAGQGGSGQNPPYTDNTISADGSRIFFTVESNPAMGVVPGSQEGKLYMREDATTTVRINASEKDPPDPTPDPARFWTISQDGSKAFFTTEEQLTDEDSDELADLYRYDHEAPAGSRLTLLSVDGEPADGTGRVVGVLGASDDGERIYFATDNQFAEGGPLWVVGAVYIFLREDGITKYVGRMDLTDRDETFGTGYFFNEKTSRVTPDGRHLLYRSLSGELAPEDPGKCNNLPCHQFYLYSASANSGQGQLQCVSCSPRGIVPSSEPIVSARYGRGEAPPGAHQNRLLSDDGRFVFFTSEEPLVARDVNGVADAYRYDSLDGNLRLLSSGTSPDPSFYMTTSRDGRDAFFTTREQLSRWDVDTSFDLYDARIGGGLPEPRLPVPSCVGDACQPPPASLNAPTPASAAFKGTGNLRQLRDCGSISRRVGKLSRRAKGLRRNAKAARSPKASKRMRGKAKRYSREAKGLGKRANRCRRANRRAAR